MINKVIGERLKRLREGINYTQSQIAKESGLMIQTAVHRYEAGLTDTPNEILMWYASYFDVSLDYIFGRTDKTEGKMYSYIPEPLNNDEMKDFVEMCFDPNSPTNAKLKEALTRILSEKDNK